MSQQVFLWYATENPSRPFLLSTAHKAPICKSLTYKALIGTSLSEGSHAALPLIKSKTRSLGKSGLAFDDAIVLSSNFLPFSFLKIYLVENPNFTLLIISPFSHMLVKTAAERICLDKPQKSFWTQKWEHQSQNHFPSWTLLCYSFLELKCLLLDHFYL